MSTAEEQASLELSVKLKAAWQICTTAANSKNVNYVGYCWNCNLFWCNKWLYAESTAATSGNLKSTHSKHSKSPLRQSKKPKAKRKVLIGHSKIWIQCFSTYLLYFHNKKHIDDYKRIQNKIETKSKDLLESENTYQELWTSFQNIDKKHQTAKKTKREEIAVIKMEIKETQELISIEK